jgi:hypothetical protein
MNLKGTLGVQAGIVNMAEREEASQQSWIHHP